MNQLEYIKSKFLEKSTLVEFISCNNELNARYIDFQKTLKNTNELIKNADNAVLVLSHIQKAQESFLTHWNFIHEHTSHSFYEKFRSLYFSANLNEPEIWLKNTILAFEEKKSNKFFELTSKGLKFIGENLSQFNSIENPEAVEKLANEIIKKYNLNHINLTNTKHSTHINYLKRLNNGLENVCHSMGITFDVIGIHGTVGFSSSPHSEALFLLQNNSIIIGGFFQNSSIILHEWIHALDYYVGNSISPGKFASNIEEAIHIEDSNTYQSFISIKKLTQEIFNSSSSLPHIEPIKKELIIQGTSKFFSELLGYDFYTLPENIKNNLHTQSSFNLVNNYLVNPSLKTNQINLLDFITSQNLQSIVITEKITNPPSEITSLKSFFDGINHNLFTEPSLYYISSKLSLFRLQLNHLLFDIFNKGSNLIKKDECSKHKVNLSDHDYFIQPIEMVARYFESQVFPIKHKLFNIVSIISGICIYKTTTDNSFENNKNKIIEHVFGKGKIIQNISDIRTNINSVEKSTEIKNLNF